MDPAEEQAMEIEALEAILMDDLVRFEGKIPDVSAPVRKSQWPSAAFRIC